MTQLLDSGYLETDDCVVAAPFIGKVVFYQHEDGEWIPRELAAPAEKGVFSIGGSWYPYPIRIPASAVAEVECGNSGIEPHWLLLCHSVDVTGSQRTLIQWLRKHTQGEE